MTILPEGAHEYMIHRDRILKEFQRSGEFFISPDFVAAQRLVIYPGKARELPVVTNAVDEDLIRYQIVHVAVRSRGAQAGLNFRIKEHTFNPNQQLLLEVEALGQRPIEIFRGDRLGRFYHERGAVMLYGNKLEEFCHTYIHNKEKNSERDDWFLVGSNSQPVDSSHRNYAVGVGLFLDEQVDLYVFPGSPVAIFDNSIKDYRAVLDGNVLKPIASDVKEPGLHISQTRATVVLPEGFNGILQYGLGNVVAAHIESHLIEGGKTNWPLRLEYVMGSLVVQYEERPYVIMHLYKNRI